MPIIFFIKVSEEFFLEELSVVHSDMPSLETDKDFIMHGLLRDLEEDTQKPKPYLKVIFGNSRVFQQLTSSTDGDDKN